MPWLPRRSWSFLLAAGFATLDEIHQTFVASRTGSIVDVGWDGLGAFLGLVGRWGIVSLNR